MSQKRQDLFAFITEALLVFQSMVSAIQGRLVCEGIDECYNILQVLWKFLNSSEAHSDLVDHSKLQRWNGLLTFEDLLPATLRTTN